jgi:hypothetical protein
MDKVLGYVDLGQRQGARLVTGGRRFGSQGFFVEPTIFDRTCLAGLTAEKPGFSAWEGGHLEQSSYTLRWPGSPSTCENLGFFSYQFSMEYCTSTEQTR